MDKIIIYYSMSENVDHCARLNADHIGTDLLRLYPVNAYPDKGFRKFYWGGRSAIMAETPELQPYEFDPERYDLIIFATPVWASNFTPPLRTFILENREKLNDKKFAAFACCSGAGGNRTLNRLKEFIGIDELISEAIFFDPKGKKDSEAKILAFAETLNI